jgi:hypothetical protein
MSQETLLSQSTVWLFGRKLDDLEIKINVYRQVPSTEELGDTANMPPRRGRNNFLLEQLRHPESDAQLARVYAFSYEAGFFDLQRPAIFLVHGPGIDPEGPETRTQQILGDLSRAPPDLGRTGLGTQSGSFASGIRAWAYDRADFTIRLDIDTGSFDSLLLSAELGGSNRPMQSSGALARSTGALARSAGALARSAGALVRNMRSPGSGDTD